MPCKFSATDWFSKLDTCILGHPSPLSVLFSVYVHSIWFHQYNFTWLQAIAHHGLSPDSVVFPSPKGEDPVLGLRQPPSHHHSQPWDLSSNFSRSALSMSWFGYFFSCATVAGFFSGPKGGPAYTSKQLCVNILEEISFSLGWIWQFHVIQIIYKSSLGKRRNFITYILNYTLDPIKNFFSPYLTELGHGLILTDHAFCSLYITPRPLHPQHRTQSRSCCYVYWHSRGLSWYLLLASMFPHFGCL